ncbi:sensor histidine kinase [Haladaptatus sp. CMAA 1911]|uniref:sensor histidine kinase n=1 Tax=unclassified Haladaptatus TaxID=2622732 RepID=UPI003753F032
MRGPDDTGENTLATWLTDATVAERCYAFVDSTTDIFTHIRPDGEMTYVTNTEAMLGRSRQEFLETPLEEFIHPEDKARAIECFESALAGTAPSTVELQFRHGDGHWIWIESSASPIPSEYDLDGVVTVTRDVTERKRREQKLKATQTELEQSNEKLRRQNRRLDRFASVVSHDFRNPLSIANGRLRRARKEHDSKYLDAMVEPIDRMARMIDELRTLTMSQRRTTKTTPVSIGSRAETAWATTDTGDSELHVLIDRRTQYEADLGLLDHIFENLFRNAVNHNREPVTVTVGSLAGRAGFYVADDGTGIPSERVDDVLEYGYSTAGEGTGVGLTIVSEFVEAHGWELTIADSEDGGAKFEISIP